MPMSRRSSATVLSLAPVLLGMAATANAADAQAGKAQFQKVCSMCHDVSDWKGKSESQLAQMIGNVNSGKAKHPKKLGLTDAQVADLSAWISSSS
jgi:cytochrome c553